MDVSILAYIAVLLAFGAGRLIEMRISFRHQQRLAVQGVGPVPEGNFRGMVLLHIGIPVFSTAEVILLRRPFIPLLALAAGVLLLLANAVRWWVMATLGDHWNIRIMDSTRLGVVTNGPFHWVRHPNYAAVFVEMLALPLILTAWLTALVGAIAHVWVLRRRVTLEEAVLMSNPAYRAAMGSKPRFVPRLLSRSPALSTSAVEERK